MTDETGLCLSEPCACGGDMVCDGEVHECDACGDHEPCPDAYHPAG